MAIKTFIRRPTIYSDATSDWRYIQNAYDYDINNTYALKNSSKKGYLNSYFSVSKFGFNLPEGTTVNDVRVSVKGSGSYTKLDGSIICCSFNSKKYAKIHIGRGNLSKPTYRTTSNVINDLKYGFGSALNALNSCVLWLFAGANSSMYSSEIKIYDIYLTAECEVPEYTLTLLQSGKGTVTGAGAYAWEDTVTISATPDSGYKFVKWSDGNTNATRTITVTENTTLTAEFELDKINKIYVGISQPKSIFIGNQEVKAVYAGTTKVYG